MSGTEQTFHYTKEDVRKMEQRDSAAHGGNVTADSNASAMQVSILQSSQIPYLHTDIYISVHC